MHISSPALVRLLGPSSSGPGPAHRRLSDLVRLAILDGRLPLASAMPAERDLAAALGVSRTTVSTAYAALRDQGYLTTRDRARSRTTVPRAGRTSPPQAGAPHPELIDFSHAAPPAPGEALHRAYTRALDQLPRYLPRHGYASAGLDELREAIAQRYTDRGLPTTADQVLVTNGALHAFALLARTLLRPRDRVVVDHPTYPHALHVLRVAGCRVLPVALTENGWDLESLSTASRGAALAYLMPDFHNPTGQCLPEQARAHLRLDCPTVVDETMADLALDVDPPLPLAVHHPDVISIGSTSKTFWGGLRVGWVRAAPDLVQQLGQARTGTDLGTPVAEQLACVELLDEIHKILPDRLNDLRRRRAHLLSLLSDHLPDWTVGPSTGGLSVWARLPHPISSALAAVAPEHGVWLAAGPRFGVGGAFERFMRLPYSLDPADMTTGIQAITRALTAIPEERRAETPPAPMA